MTSLTLKFNNSEDHAEFDWLVIEDGRIVQGFASSNAATRWIDDRNAQRILDRALKRRASREATRDPVTKRLP